MSMIRGKVLAGSLAGMLALGLVFDAEAKRMGGSRSFGKQSSSVTQQRQQAPQQTPAQQQQPAQQAAPAAAGAGAAAAAAPRRNWGGILGGIAAGLGIGWLLSHLGLGGAALTFLSNLILIALIAAVAIWLIRKFRGGAKRPQPAYAGAGAAAGGTGLGRTEIGSGLDRNREPMLRQPLSEPRADTGAGAAAQPVMASEPAAQPQPFGVPADFDTDAFLRNAKVYFVRLQAAWDAGNLDDIREFTTPEMFAEIKMDLSERGNEPNKTDVVTLEAALLGIETSETQHVASVRFSGMIREAEGAAAQPFAEVWNLAKPVNGAGGWVLAGIQQES